MLRHRVVTALVAFLSFWVMYALFSLLGGRFDLTIALAFAVAALAVAVVFRTRRARRSSGAAESAGPQPL